MYPAYEFTQIVQNYASPTLTHEVDSDYVQYMNSEYTVLSIIGIQ